MCIFFWFYVNQFSGKIQNSSANSQNIDTIYGLLSLLNFGVGKKVFSGNMIIDFND